MKSQNSTSSISKGFFAAFAASVLLVGFLAWRVIREGLPVIMQDEFVYQQSSFFRSDSEPSPYGTYIFDFLYRMTSTCGNEFYSCSKIISVVLVILTSIVITVSLLSLTNRYVALTIGVIHALSAFTFYSSFFMPEVLLGFFLISSIFLLFRFLESKSLGFYVSLGLVLGLALATKFHGIFSVFAAAIAAVFMYAGATLLRRIFIGAGLVFLAFGVRLIIGFAMDGFGGLSLIPSGYQILAANKTVAVPPSVMVAIGPESSANLSSQLNFDPAPSVIAASTTHIGLYVTAILLVTGGIFLLPRLRAHKLDSATRLHKLWLILQIMFFVFAFASISFGIIVSSTGDSHIYRPLLRYLEFLLPLVICVGSLNAVRYSKDFQKWVTALVPTVSIMFSWVVLQNTQTTFSDSPWFFSLATSSFTTILIGSILAGCAQLLAQFSSSGKLKLAPALVVILFGTWVTLGTFNNLAATKGDIDEVGSIASQELQEIPGEDILILGKNAQRAATIAFYMNKAKVKYQVIEEGFVANASEFSESNYIILIDGVSYSERGKKHLTIADSGEILALSTQESLSLSAVGLESGLSFDKNLSSPSTSGRWILGQEAQLEFIESFSKNQSFNLTLATDPSERSNAIVEFRCGDQSITVALEGSGRVTSGTITFANVENLNKVEIVIRTPGAKVSIIDIKPR